MDDLISRRKAFEYFVTLWECIGMIMDRDEWEDVCMTTANEIPSAHPQHNPDEWCHDCKEYDQQKHCCLRWNRVIRETVKELKSEQSDFDITVKIDKAYDDGYEAGYLQGRHDWGDLDG